MTPEARGRQYEFVLRGEIGDRFALLFDGMRLERVAGTHGPDRPGASTRPQLHGVIARIQELGIELVSVNPVNEPRSTSMSAPAATPDTIVLIHGFWVTPRSWEHWIDALRGARATRVLAPAYPGFEVEVEALNADPSPIEAVTVPQIIEPPRGRRRRARHAADPDGPLRRRRRSPRSCSTTASAPPASRSTRRPPRACR